MLQPRRNDSIHLLRPLPQSPMRSIDLFDGQIRNMLRHGFTQMRRQGRILQSLDKKNGDSNAPTKNSQLILEIDLASSVPVHCIGISLMIRQRSLEQNSNNIHGP